MARACRSRLTNGRSRLFSCERARRGACFSAMRFLPLLLAVSTTILAVMLRRSHWSTQALRSSRAAYVLLLLQALLYFPGRSGFQIAAPVCQWTFDFALAVHSLRNYPHIILFAIFFFLTYVQLRNVEKRLLWSTVICMAMGLFVELAQGATRAGNCRMRDLIPDAVGALIAASIIVAARKLRRKEPSSDARR